MRLFGYRDLRVFFIPFFGAVASGTNEEAPAWQRAVILLMGPVPGIALGVILLLGANPSTPRVVVLVARLLIWVNAFNLLPLEPLDGGRLLHLLLFSRHHALELVFLVITGLVLGAIGFALDTKVLVVIAAIGVLVARARADLTRRANGVRREWGAMQLATAPELYYRALFEEADRSIRARRRTPTMLANQMRAIHDRAAVPSLRRAWALLLLLAYGGAVVVACFGIVLAQEGRRPPAQVTAAVAHADSTWSFIPRERDHR